MEWNNESVFEFIELLQGEPDIWDPKCKGHKNRNNINDAWIRIQNKFSIPCTIGELKRNRNTLLTQYRECLKKIKDSTKTGSSAEDIYKPSWFAFDAIHTFMGDVYEYRMTICTETMEKTEETQHLDETDSLQTSSISTSSKGESREWNNRSISDSFASKRPRGAQEIKLAKIQRCNKESQIEVNYCDLYGKLLAHKLKPLDIDDRLILMNEIDNIVFKYTMSVRQRKTVPTTVYSPSVNQNQKVRINQAANLPATTQLVAHTVAPKINQQKLKSFLNYHSSTPFRNTNPQNTNAIKINFPEVHSSALNANYVLYTSYSNSINDALVPSISHKTYNKSEVSQDKKIKIISQIIVTPKRCNKNIIQEVYNQCEDGNNDTDSDGNEY